jgi:cysteine-rich repeat protein
MTTRVLWGLWVALGGAQVACGGASGEDATTRGAANCDAGRCDGDGPRDSVGDDDDEPAPCPDANRRDVTELDFLQAAPTAIQPEPENPVNPGNPVTPAPTPYFCGDAVVISPETCDDGNADDGDGCSATCAIEEGFSCVDPGAPCVRIAVCGDGVLDAPELCDDANLDPTDGCDAACRLLPGYSCPTPNAPCTTVCGDLLVRGDEQCDDGNDSPGDGCNAFCRVEPGFVCTEVAQSFPTAAAEDVPEPEPPSEPPAVPCRPSECGDGVVESGEACDDANQLSGDGCADCVLEPVCTADACETVCGDAIHVESAGEACDDGNLSPRDGCDESCQVENGYTCAPGADDAAQPSAPVDGEALPRSACTSVCGDSLAVAEEACDDGSQNGEGYGMCASDCTPGRRCGDGVVQEDYEECDDGVNAVPYSAAPSCGPGCRISGYCGDAIVDAAYGEQCDLGTDANTGAYDGCASDCTRGPRCGDGVVQGIEQCDDGNPSPGDGCSPACRAESIEVIEPEPSPGPAPTGDVFIPDAQGPLNPDSPEPDPAPCP